MTKISSTFQILKPSEKKAKYQYQGINRWNIPPHIPSKAKVWRQTFQAPDPARSPEQPWDEAEVKRKYQKRIHEKSGGLHIKEEEDFEEFEIPSTYYIQSENVL